MKQHTRHHWDLSKSQLVKRLKSIEKQYHEMQNAPEHQRLNHNLYLHQIELELQNRELRETQQELEATTQRFADLYDYAPVGYLTFNRKGLIREVNLTGSFMLGKPKTLLENTPFNVFLPSKGEIRRFMKHLHDVFSSDEKISTELQIRNQNKGQLHISIESMAVQSARGKEKTCRSILLDITLKKQAEEQLKTSNDMLEKLVEQRTAALAQANTSLKQEIKQRQRFENRLRLAAAVFDNSNEAIIITDADHIVVSVNPAFSKVTGLETREVTGRRINDLLVKNNHQPIHHHLPEPADPKSQWQGEGLYLRKNAGYFPAWINISSITDEQGEVANYVIAFSDISPIKKTQEYLHHIAHHDPLTGIANRLLFEARLESSLQRAHRNNKSVALLFMDLDRFKHINDTLGHKSGDQILQEVAKRLSETVRSEDTVARLGGDEFAIVLNEIAHPEDAAIFAEKLLKKITQPIKVDHRRIETNSSIGISIFPFDSENIIDLQKAADTALYMAKSRDEENYKFYANTFSANASDYLSMERDLKNAIKNRDFALLFQPQLHYNNHDIVGAEALLRWEHYQKGLVSPDHCLPLIEDNALIIEIFHTAFSLACRQAAEWRNAGLNNLTLGLNISGMTLLHDVSLLSFVEQTLAESGASGAQLELEIPEPNFQDMEKCAQTVEGLSALGIRLAVDNYGLGRTNLRSLIRLPIGKIKIDRSIIAGLPHNTLSTTFTKTTVAMASHLGIQVAAIGVENASQQAYLEQNHCAILQGRQFSEPLSPQAFLHYARSGG